MSSVQIRDILESLRSFYRQLSEQFTLERQRVSGGQLPFLLEYIAAHEKQLESSVEEFEESTDAGLLDTWLQFGADEALENILSQLDLHEGMAEDDILAAALQVDDRLIALYRQLAGESSVPQVQDLFDGFTNMQEARERQLARAIR